MIENKSENMKKITWLLENAEKLYDWEMDIEDAEIVIRIIEDFNKIYNP